MGAVEGRAGDEIEECEGGVGEAEGEQDVKAVDVSLFVKAACLSGVAHPQTHDGERYDCQQEIGEWAGEGNEGFTEASAEAGGIDGHGAPGDADEEKCGQGHAAHVNERVHGDALQLDGSAVAERDGGDAVGEFVEADADHDGENDGDIVEGIVECLFEQHGREYSRESASRRYLMRIGHRGTESTEESTERISSSFSVPSATLWQLF